MSAPTTDLLALLDSDPAAGILAAADRVDQLAAGAAAWETAEGFGFSEYDGAQIANRVLAAASPEYWSAVSRRWRGVVERHGHRVRFHAGDDECDYCSESWPCPDLTETADEARAYLGGAS